MIQVIDVINGDKISQFLSCVSERRNNSCAWGAIVANAAELKGKAVALVLSGRGDKDVDSVLRAKGL